MSSMAKKKIVLVGCGGMSKAWFAWAKERPELEFAGLVDISRDAAANRAKEQGLACPVFTDLAEALAATKADIVFDVTIPAAHHSVVTTALKAGCHVFGEKPLAETAAQADEMVALAKSTGRTYAIMQNRRYNKKIRGLRQFIEGGTIGKPTFAHADFFIGAHFGGFRDAMASPLLLDMAIHTFDEARFILKADPVSVYCHEWNPAGSWYAGNAMAACIFEMSGGMVFTYNGSWCAEGANTSWEASWRIVGSKGTAMWDGNNPPWAEAASGDTGFTRPQARHDSPMDWAGRDGHNGCLDEMYSALSDGRQPETHGADNRKSLAMVFAALESARLGKKVAVI